jgi:hypothetical protein
MGGPGYDPQYLTKYTERDGKFLTGDYWTRIRYRPEKQHRDWTDQIVHGRVARGGHGFPKVTSGPAMPYPSTPSRRATPEMA